MTNIQVAVVGAGPAGLAAASAAASAGASVTLFDEQSEPGGQLRYRRLAEQPIGSRSQLIENALAAGVRIETDSAVWSAFSGNELGISHGGVSRFVTADKLVITTGSTDRPAAFPGSTLPGVVTARAMQILLNIHRLRPGKRFVVFGSGIEAEEVLSDLRAAGAEVQSATSTSEISASGDGGVEEVSIDGVVSPADGIVIAVGRLPDAQLAFTLEVATAWSPGAGAWIPRVDVEMRSSIPNVWIAGDAAGVTDITDAIRQGQVAGRSVASSLGLGGEVTPDHAFLEDPSAEVVAQFRHHSWRGMVKSQ